MADRKIPNTAITAMSVKGQSYAYLARLHNVPEGNEITSFWQPMGGKKDEVLEIKLGTPTRITGIATQGHYNKEINEFVSDFNVYYNTMNTWKEYPKVLLIVLLKFITNFFLLYIFYFVSCVNVLL